MYYIFITKSLTHDKTWTIFIDDEFDLKSFNIMLIISCAFLKNLIQKFLPHLTSFSSKVYVPTDIFNTLGQKMLTLDYWLTVFGLTFNSLISFTLYIRVKELIFKTFYSRFLV